MEDVALGSIRHAVQKRERARDFEIDEVVGRCSIQHPARQTPHFHLTQYTNELRCPYPSAAAEKLATTKRRYIAIKVTTIWMSAPAPKLLHKT